MTLYHWDLPQALEDRGGWPSRDTVEAFAEYVEVVGDRLGDRVRNWITQNEPWVISWLGYGLGVHAPGRTSEADALAAGAPRPARPRPRGGDPAPRSAEAQVGITIDLVAIPAAHRLRGGPRRGDAARTASRNRWFLDPVLRGEYPADMLEALRADPPARSPTATWRRSPRRSTSSASTTTRAASCGRIRERGAPVTVAAEDVERTAMGWEVYPDGLHGLLVRLRDDYDVPPLYITENGAAYADAAATARVDDPRRISYLERHLDARRAGDRRRRPRRRLLRLVAARQLRVGDGYSQRFGLVYVDYATLERVPKASYRWYRDLIAASRAGQPA